MTNLEERCLEIEGVVFKMDYGEEGSFYSQVILADPAIGITAKALESFGHIDEGSECLCLNNKYILEWHDELRLEREFEFTLRSIEDRYLNRERLMALFYPENYNDIAECAFK